MQSTDIQALSSPSAQVLQALAMDIDNLSCGEIRKGVEAREIVLRQVEFVAEIIELSSDEDEEPGPKRRRLHDDLWSSCEQRPSQQTLADVMSESTEHLGSSSEHQSIPKSKKRLFRSISSTEEIHQQPGPPTPPKSPYELFYDTQTASNFIEPSSNNKTADFDDEAAMELSVELSQFFEPPKARQPPSLSDKVLNHVKMRIEAEGITRSRQLREKRRAEITSEPVAGMAQKSCLHLILQDIDRSRDEYTNSNRGSARVQNKSQALEDKARIVCEPIKFSLDNPTLPPLSSIPKSSASFHSLRDDSYRKNIVPSIERDARPLDDCMVDRDGEKRRRERLQRMLETQRISSRRKSRLISSPHQARSYPTTFRMPDMSDSQSNAGTHRDLRKLMGITQLEKSASNQDTDEENDKNNTAASIPMVSLATLQKLNYQDQTSYRDFYEELKPQGEDLSLPHDFESRSQHVQHKIREREILKERAKDFEAISKTFELFAKLGALRPFKDIEFKELDELKRFCDAVFEKKLSGKRARSRIKDIAGNMRKRIKSVGETPSADNTDEVLQSILKSEYLNTLNNEGAEIKTKLQYIGEAVRKNSKKRRPHSREIVRMNDFQATGPKRVSKIDEKIAAMESTLARFERDESINVDNGYDSDVDVIDLGKSQSNAECDDSEEDDGEVLMRPIGLNVLEGGQGPAEIQHEDLEHFDIPGNEDIFTIQQTSTEISKTHIMPSTSQNFDQSLINRMKLKQLEQTHSLQQNSQILDHDLLKQNVEREALRMAPKVSTVDDMTTSETNTRSITDDEFEDSDLDTVPTEDEPAEPDDYDRPQCWRYVVNLVECNGFSTEIDGHESVQGRFVSYDRAKRHLEALVAEMKEQYCSQHQSISSHYWNSQIEENHGMYDFVMTNANDNSHGCHFQIERELHNPSKEAYEKAKIRNACQPLDTWFVDWERVICAYVEEPEENEEQDLENGSQSVDGQDVKLPVDDREQHRELSSDRDEQEVNANKNDQKCDLNEDEGVTETAEQKLSDDNTEVSNTFPEIGDAEIAETKYGSEDKSASTDQPQHHDQTPTESGSAPLVDPLSSASIDNTDSFDDLDNELFGPDPVPEPILGTQDDQQQELPGVVSLNSDADAGAITSPLNTSPLAQHALASTDTDPSQTVTTAPDTGLESTTAPASTSSQLLEASYSSSTTSIDQSADGSVNPESTIMTTSTATSHTTTIPLLQAQEQARDQAQLIPDPIITRMGGDDVRVFPSVAQANRYASDCFMGWYLQHDSVKDNEQLIENTKSEIEEELEFHGHLEPWQHEDYFTYVDDNGCEMVDKFKVWVRKAPSWGPSN